MISFDVHAFHRPAGGPVAPRKIACGCASKSG